MPNASEEVEYTEQERQKVLWWKKMTNKVFNAIWFRYGSHKRVEKWPSTGYGRNLRIRYLLASIWMEGFKCDNWLLVIKYFLDQPYTAHTTEAYAFKP